jgi:hypothetical protein
MMAAAAELDIACLQRKNPPMCTRYISPEEREIEDFWRIGARTREGLVRDMRPLYQRDQKKRVRLRCSRAFDDVHTRLRRSEADGTNLSILR